MQLKLRLTLTLLSLLPVLINAQQNSLAFDNVDDQVTVSNASAVIANATGISLTMWVYPTNTAITFPDYDGFAGFRNNTSADFYIIQHISTSVEARFRNSAGTAFDVVVSGLLINQWQQFVLTYDGTTLSLYQNGILVGSTPASGTISSNTETFYMGNMSYQGTNFFLKGKLDEVSVWNRGLTSQEVSCIYNNHIDPAESGLKLYYKFNQGIAGGNNSTINSITNMLSGYNGTMQSFAKTGTISNFVAGIVKGTVDSTTICQGDTVFFGSQAITTAGSYVQAFTTTSICDSIVELSVSITQPNLSVAQSSTTLTSAQAGATYQWLNCSAGNTPVAGATNQVYSPTANGVYSVIVTLNGCSDTSSCITFNTVGIQEIDRSMYSVSPNPFRDQLILRPAINGYATVQAIDITGKIIYTESTVLHDLHTIPTSGWKPGTYFVKVITDTGVWIDMVVKN